MKENKKGYRDDYNSGKLIDIKVSEFGPVQFIKAVM